MEPSTSSSAPCEYVIRRGTQRDARSLALVCAEAFGRGNFPGVESEALDRLEERYANVIEEGMEIRLVDALDAKAQAQREHREFRLRLHMQQLRAELAALRGEAARFVTQPSPQDLRMVARWRRSRQFMILVAEEKEVAADSPDSALALEAGQEAGHGRGQQGGTAVACASLSLMQPEALLPPPFPSSKPFRLYVSNMSVLPSHRRRGLAKRLLQECERVARLWGYSSLWLHVKRRNAAAAALYLSMGYRSVDEGGLRLLPGPLAQELMCKDLPPVRSGCPVVLSRAGLAGVAARGGAFGGGSVEEGVQGVSGASRDGVFVWNAVLGDKSGDDSE